MRNNMNRGRWPGHQPARYNHNNRAFNDTVRKTYQSDMVKDGIHMPAICKWHTDGMDILKTLANTSKVLRAEDFRDAMARARWTLSKYEAAAFMLWMYKKRNMFSGSWPCFVSDTAETSNLNEDAVYTYLKPVGSGLSLKNNLLKRFFSLFKKRLSFAR